MQRISREERIALIVLLAASLYPFAVALLYVRGPNDDPLITLTYAKSLALGKGFVYNAPPATLGTTTPLSAFLLALLLKVLPFIDPARMLLLFSAFFWSASAWVIYLGRKGLRLGHWEALTVALAMLARGNTNTLYMEERFFFCMLLLAIVLVAGRYVFWGGIATTLLFLVRGEGAFLAPLLGVYLLVQWRSRPESAPLPMPQRLLRPEVLRYIAGGAVLLAVWLVYAQMTFGAIFPLTMKAKILQGRIMQGGLFLDSWPKSLSGLEFLTWGGAAFLFVALAIPGVVFAVWRRSPIMIVLVWTAVFMGLYGALRVPWYWWYAAPIVNALYLFAGLGLVALLHAGIRWKPSKPGRALAVLAVAFYLVGSALPGLGFARAPLTEANVFYLRYPAYKAVATWLTGNAQPEDAVAIAEIGHLGFYSNQPIFDFYGLVTPAQLESLERKRPADGFWLAKPRFFVSFRDRSDLPAEAVIHSPQFDAHYKLAYTYPCPQPWGECLVFQRKDAATPQATAPEGAR
ncbi:MAG: hypothetical protein HYV27_09615 [Candidatus Hydrogenedentes bacterium]|nr:hypothetical protein [Candidatus Hydrogenedentota bacterium]